LQSGFPFAPANYAKRCTEYNVRTRHQIFSKPGHSVVCVILPLTHKDADVIFHGHLSAIHFYVRKSISELQIQVATDVFECGKLSLLDGSTI